MLVSVILGVFSSSPFIQLPGVSSRIFRDMFLVVIFGTNKGLLPLRLFRGREFEYSSTCRFDNSSVL